MDSLRHKKISTESSDPKSHFSKKPFASPDLSSNIEEDQAIIEAATKLLANPKVKSVVFTRDRKRNVRKKLRLVQVDADGNEMTEQSITKYLERAAPAHQTAPKDDKNVCVLFTNFTSEGDYINDHDYLVNPYVRNKMFYYYNSLPVCECLLCDFVHQAKDHVDHMKSHDTTCKVCLINFHNVFILNLHVRCHAKYCTRCSEYVSYAQLEQHASLHAIELSKHSDDFRLENTGPITKVTKVEKSDLNSKEKYSSPRKKSSRGTRDVLSDPKKESGASSSKACISRRTIRRSRRVLIRSGQNDFAVEDTMFIGDNTLKPGEDSNCMGLIENKTSETLIPEATQLEHSIFNNLLCDESIENMSEEHTNIDGEKTTQSGQKSVLKPQQKDVEASKKLNNPLGKTKKRRKLKIPYWSKVNRLKMRYKLKNSSNKINNVSGTDATKNCKKEDEEIPELLGAKQAGKDSSKNVLEEQEKESDLKLLPDLTSSESKISIDTVPPEEDCGIDKYLSEELKLRLKDIDLNPYVYLEKTDLPFNAVTLKLEESDIDVGTEEVPTPKKRMRRERNKNFCTQNIANDTPSLKNDSTQDDSTVPHKIEPRSPKKTVHIRQNKERKRNESLEKRGTPSLNIDSTQDDSILPDKTLPRSPKKTVNIRQNKERKHNKSLDKSDTPSLKNDSIQDDSTLPNKIEPRSPKKYVNIRQNKERKLNKSLDKCAINKDGIEKDAKPSQIVNIAQNKERKLNKSLDKSVINKDGIEKDVKSSPILNTSETRSSINSGSPTIKTRSSRSRESKELLGGLVRVRKLYNRPKKTAKVASLNPKNDALKDGDFKHGAESLELFSDVLETKDLKIDGSVPDVKDSQSKGTSDFGVQLNKQNESIDELEAESLTVEEKSEKSVPNLEKSDVELLPTKEQKENVD